MIKFIDGDIFKQKDLYLIIHQANCFNRMKSGIAAQIAVLYPEAVEADNRTKPGDITKLGTYTCGVGKDGIHIINAYGQLTYGGNQRNTDYDALKSALSEVRDDYGSSYAVTGDQVKIGIPFMIGCGLGGGEWSIVYEIISEIFEDDDRFSVLICKKGDS